MALVVGLGLAAGCTNADRALTGRWASTMSLSSDWLVGRPELAIGHYGTELTGVAWFLDADGIVPRVCPCSFIDNRAVDVAHETFNAQTTFCDNSTWIWRLTLDDTVTPPELAGTVEVAGDASRVLDISFALVDTFIPDEEKLCPPP